MSKEKAVKIKAKITNDVCLECGAKLPDPIYEERLPNHFESVTYCPNCGATSTGGF